MAASSGVSEHRFAKLVVAETDLQGRITRVYLGRNALETIDVPITFKDTLGPLMPWGPIEDDKMKAPVARYIREQFGYDTHADDVLDHWGSIGLSTTDGQFLSYRFVVIKFSAERDRDRTYLTAFRESPTWRWYETKRAVEETFRAAISNAVGLTEVFLYYTREGIMVSTSLSP